MSHYCKQCQKDVDAIDDGGVQSCGMCGLQLDDLVLQSGPTFVQDGNFSHMAGTIIREEDLAREGGAIMGSGRDRSAQKGRQCIRSFAEALEIDEALVQKAGLRFAGAGQTTTKNLWSRKHRRYLPRS